MIMTIAGSNSMLGKIVYIISSSKYNFAFLPILTDWFT